MNWNWNRNRNWELQSEAATETATETESVMCLHKRRTRASKCKVKIQNTKFTTNEARRGRRGAGSEEGGIHPTISHTVYHKKDSAGAKRARAKNQWENWANVYTNYIALARLPPTPSLSHSLYLSVCLYYWHIWAATVLENKPIALCSRKIQMEMHRQDVGSARTNSEYVRQIIFFQSYIYFYEHVYTTIYVCVCVCAWIYLSVSRQEQSGLKVLNGHETAALRRERERTITK